MNKKELRACMARYGDTNQTLAEALGISQVAFSKKINAITDFRQNEIKKIILRYDLDPESLNTIFFGPEVESEETTIESK